MKFWRKVRAWRLRNLRQERERLNRGVMMASYRAEEEGASWWAVQEERLNEQLKEVRRTLQAATRRPERFSRAH